MDAIDDVLTRGVEKIYPSKEILEKVLRSGKRIRIYQGFDPSMPNLHLGNLVGIFKLKQFQELGHEIIFLIGDFTGMIGDPSGKSETRKPLTRRQVLTNSKNYQKQAGQVLKFEGKNPAKVLYNSQWLDKLSFTELLNLASCLTYQQVKERDMFQKREKEGKDIYINEFLYPLMQGYDSVFMDVDLEIGGSDQLFNMMTGRDLMRKLKHKEKLVMTTKLLVDKEGNKVGKTTGNALFLNSSANDFYGGIMSFPDEVICLAFELLTMVPLADIKKFGDQMKSGKINPMNLKKKLAFEILAIYFTTGAAKKAQNNFEEVFQKRNVPAQMPVFVTRRRTYNIVELLVDCQLCGSRSEAKRLLNQKSVDLEGEVVNDLQKEVSLKNGVIIRVGKKRFVKITI